MGEWKHAREGVGGKLEFASRELQQCIAYIISSRFRQTVSETVAFEEV